MEKFVTHTGSAAPLRRSNVDTDQIIPAEFLKRITRHGFEDGLFKAWKNDPEFVLNKPEYQKASILIAGPERAATLAAVQVASMRFGLCKILDSNVFFPQDLLTFLEETPVRQDY